MNKSVVLLLLIAALTGSIWGCGMLTQKEGNERAVDYTVVGEKDLPETVQEILQEKRQEVFQMTYQEENQLFLLQGYGIQNSGGYSIQVEKVTENDQELHIKTKLIGPNGGEKEKNGLSCPVIVVKVENRNKKVVFE